MRIGIIIPYATITYSGGVEEQGRMWKRGLEILGDEVFLVNYWEKYDWKTFDWILFLANGPLLRDYLDIFKKYSNLRFACAPIIDFSKSMLSFIARTRLHGIDKLSYRKPLNNLYRSKEMIDLFLVRSEYEKAFLTKGMGIPERKIKLVPLHFRIDPSEANFNLALKEDFVFHVSRLSDPVKNVPRLIDSAIKYGYNLVLGGNAGGTTEEIKLKEIIDKHDNIKYLGWLTDEKLLELYKRAKVFSLPSISEGVGMVAMEAALYGCNIVLTNIGGPKEYFDNKAFLVNPFDVDDIGQKTLQALNDSKSQPELSDYMSHTYNEESCMGLLQSALTDA